MKTFASVALSGDGCMDDCSSRRLILSTPADWRDVLRLRADADAILVGAETIRRDDPSLTLHDETLQRRRLAEGRGAEPMKVTLSRSLRLDPCAKFFTTGLGKRLIFTTSDAPTPLEASATLIRCPELTAARIVTELEKRGIRRLFIEGGPRTLRMFLDANLIDTLRVAVNPAIRVDDPRAPHFNVSRDSLTGTQRTRMRARRATRRHSSSRSARASAIARRVGSRASVSSSSVGRHVT